MAGIQIDQYKENRKFDKVQNSNVRFNYSGKSIQASRTAQDTHSFWSKNCRLQSQPKSHRTVSLISLIQILG
jgi:hypothetical protein